MIRRLTLAALVCATSCTTAPITTPTRSLDRPSDVALVCARLDGAGGVEMKPLDECSKARLLETRSGGRLFLLVSNTTRGEVALASAGSQFADDPITPDAGTGGIIDLDPQNPGFGFIPVGALPEPVRATNDGRVAVTANQGDCNLSVIDVQRAIAIPASPTPVGSVSCPLQPRVRDTEGKLVPLGGRVSWVEISPRTGQPAGQAGEVTCSVGAGYRALVALPSCQLVAEVMLDTGEVTQAVRVTRDGTSVVPKPWLSSLRCEAECRGVPAAEFDGGALPDLASEPDDGGGGVPVDASVPPSDGGGGGNMPDLGLPPLLPQAQAFPHTLLLGDVGGRTTLFVGDAVSPNVRTITFDAGGTTFESTGGLTLQGAAGGVSRMRLSRRIPNLDMAHYVYAIARDNTVRVVDADTLRECETNPDPDDVTALVNKVLAPQNLFQDLRQNPAASQTERALRCLPADGTPVPALGRAVHRAAQASGPGIALPLGSLPRDVAFVHNETQPMATSGKTGPVAAPGILLGDFAFIMSSAGNAHAVNIADQCPQPNTPTGLTSCVPERFGFIPSAVAGAPDDDVSTKPDKPQPRAIDVMPNRLRSGARRFDPQATATDPIAGGARLTDVPVVNGTSQSVGLASDPRLCDVQGSVCSQVAPGLGLSEANHLVAFRADPPASAENWSVVWEGIVPGTSRSSGAVVPESVENGVLSAGLYDNGGAFCTRGVRRGDKLSLDGCGSNDDCGPDEVCFLDPLSSVSTRGLCVVNVDPGLTQVKNGACRPWSLATLRYRVVRAAQDRLTVQEISLPEHPTDSRLCASDADCDGFKVTMPKGGSFIQIDTACRKDGQDANGAQVRRCVATCLVDDTFQSAPCGDGFVCNPSQFGDEDPLGAVHTVRKEDKDIPVVRCMRAPLPDQGHQQLCLPQLQRFDVRVGESFAARGDATGFLHDDFPDPADPISGECMQGTPAPGNSRLVNGRIPLLQGAAVTAPFAPTAECNVTTQANWLQLDSENGSNTNTCSLRQALQPAACKSSTECGTHGNCHPLKPPGDTMVDCASAPAGTCVCAYGACASDNECPIDGSDVMQMKHHACIDHVCRTPDAYLRWDNPYFSFVIDVPPRQTIVEVNMKLATALISRVPEDGTIMQFTIVGGTRGLQAPLGIDVLAQMPRSAVTAPDGTTIYVVDEGKQSTGTGLRGQVLRFFTDSQSTDGVFSVR